MGEQRRNFSDGSGFAQVLIDLPEPAVFTAHLSCWEDNSPSTAGEDLAVITWRVQAELRVLGGLVPVRDHLLAQPLSGYPPFARKEIHLKSKLTSMAASVLQK